MNKKILILIISCLGLLSLVAGCDNSNNKAVVNEKPNDTAKVAPAERRDIKGMTSVNNIVAGYLQVKNALVNDNGRDAAASSQVILDAIEHMDTSSLTLAQKKAYMDVADDIKENAEHCSKNGNKIEHQREHFEMLTEDMYSLLKSVSPQQTLYYDYCPMKKNYWISETKEIKNPYFGKKMVDCGAVREEIK